MSIQQFYNQAQRRDFARVFQFRVLSIGNTALGPEDNIYIETASLPGRIITNVPVPYMGLSFNVPGTASYPGSAGYNITFRCDEKYDIRSILEAELFKTFDEASSTGDYNTPLLGSTLAFQLLGKQKNGAGGGALAGGKGEPSVVRSYTLFGTYIQALQDAAYDIKDTGTVQTVQATIAYQFWRATSGSTPTNDPTSPVPLRSNSR